MNNIELLVKYRNKINWLNKTDWNGYSSTNLTFQQNFNGNSSVYWNGGGVSTISNTILDKNTDYRIQLEFTKSLPVILHSRELEEIFSISGLKIYVGDNYYYVSDAEFGEVVEFTISTGNSGLLRFTNGSFGDMFGICNVYIEKISPISLDLLDDVDIPLTYSVSDIKDIGKRKSTYSKEFSLPGTNKNNNFFGYIFNVNEDCSFNPNVKVNAMITSNKRVMLEGYIQMSYVVKNEDKYIYSIIFFSNVIDLLTKIGNDKISDLDWNDFNHTSDYTTVRGTWFGSTDFVYPYIDYGLNTGGLRGHLGSIMDETIEATYSSFPTTDVTYDNIGVSVGDLYPAVRVKAVIDKIFDTYGFTYSSSLFDSVTIANMILPFSGSKDRLKYNHKVCKFSPDYNMKNIHIPIRNGNFINENGTLSTVCDYQFLYLKNRNTGISNERHYGIPCAGGSPYTPLDKTITRDYDYEGRLNWTPYIGKDLSSLTLAGTSSWDDGPQMHFPLIPGMYACRADTRYRMKIAYTVNSFSSGSGSRLQLQAIKINKDGVLRVSDSTSTTGTPNPRSFSISSDADQYVETVANIYSSTSYQTDEITFSASEVKEGDMIGFQFLKVSSTSTPGDAEDILCDINIDYIEIEELSWGRGCEVKGKDFVPEDYKISDFLSDILTMFNAYVDIDEDDVTNLIIEPRNSYYDLGTTRDWSSKLDLDSDIKIEHPKEFVSSSLNLRYSEGKDYWNNYYNINKDPYKVGYGGKKIFLEDDFNTGSKDIKLSIQPSIIRSDWKTETEGVVCNYTSFKDGTDEIKYNLKTEIGNRILFYTLSEFHNNTGDTIKFRFEGNEDALFISSTAYYPYSGHLQFINNINISPDINFVTSVKNYEYDIEQIMFERVPEHTISDNNLYNVYWKSYIDEINDKDARLVTANFNLDDNDLIDFSLSDNIFVDGTYYTINKIKDYIPGYESLTEVELLKRTDISVDYVTGSTTTTETGLGGVPTEPGIGITIGRGNSSKVKDQPSLIIGNRNTTTDGGLIVGNNNKSSGGVILDSDSVSMNEKSSVISSSNITVGITGVTVINESNKNITEKGTYISGIKIDDGEITSTTQVNKPGQDTVQVDFSNAVINKPGDGTIYDKRYIDSNRVNKPQ